MSISKFNIIRHDVIECEFCHKQIKSLGISTHLLVKHNIHSREYYDKYLKEPDENICKNCGKTTKFVNFTYGYRRYCCRLCARQSEEAKLSASETWRSHTDEWKQEVKLRIQNTYFQKTGYHHNWSNPDSRQKCIDTYFKETGYTHNMKNPEHLKQRSEEYFRKTGYYHNWSNPESFAKCQQTYYEKTGYKNPAQNPNIQLHTVYGFYYNDIYFDSHWEYELYEALQSSKNVFEYHPKITFTYIKEKQEHKYKPDFIINGKFYEVKGDFFFNDNNQLINPFTKELQLEKQECMIKNNVIILKRKELDILIEKIRNNIII